jgi:hypothetical protein
MNTLASPSKAPLIFDRALNRSLFFKSRILLSRPSNGPMWRVAPTLQVLADHPDRHLDAEFGLNRFSDRPSVPQCKEQIHLARISRRDDRAKPSFLNQRKRTIRHQLPTTRARHQAGFAFSHESLAPTPDCRLCYPDCFGDFRPGELECLPHENCLTAHFVLGGAGKRAGVDLFHAENVSQAQGICLPGR